MPKLLLAWSAVLGGIFSHTTVAADRLDVFVSIPPQKYLVERVVGPDTRVRVLTATDPEHFEPGPGQMQALLDADLFVPLGIRAETRWLNIIKEQAPALRVVDCCRQLMTRREEGNYQDPHVWLDPILAMRMAAIILQDLIEIRPAEAEYLQSNYQRLASDLEQLDADIRARLARHAGQTFLVGHPAWGYLADRYGLKQVALEVEGREIGPRTMAERIRQARELGIRTVFVQKQHKSTAAVRLAEAIDARVVTLDPLAENPLENLRITASLIAEGF